MWLALNLSWPISIPIVPIRPASIQANSHICFNKNEVVVLPLVPVIPARKSALLGDWLNQSAKYPLLFLGFSMVRIGKSPSLPKAISWPSLSVSNAVAPALLASRANCAP